MPQTTFGQTDALALAVVAWLSAGMFATIDNPEQRAFCMPIAAERRFALIDNLTDIPGYLDKVSVDVFPDIETSNRQGISNAFISQYGVHIFIQQQLTGASDEEAQCSLLTQLRSEIIEGIKLRAFDLTNAVHQTTKLIAVEIQNVDRGFRGKGLYSLDRLLQQHVYESDTILIFKAAA
jgi:hypothetical protein